MTGRNVETQPLPLQRMPPEAVRIRPRRCDRDLRISGLEIPNDVVRRFLAQREPDLRRDFTERLQQIRDQPGRDRMQERQPNGARVRVEQGVDPDSGRIHRGDTRPSSRKRQPAVGVEPDPPVLALEQPNPEGALDPAKGAGQIRLTGPE